MNKKILMIIIVLLAIGISFFIGFILAKKIDLDIVKNNTIVNIAKEENNAQSRISNTTIQGIVQEKSNEGLIITEYQYFGPVEGCKIEEYTFAVVNTNNNKCIDYFTQKEYDLDYVDIGDILICTGDLIQNRTRGDDFDTKENSIIVLKMSDYEKMKKEALSNKNTTILISDTYIDIQYLYLKYDIVDNTTMYHFPFIEKAYIKDSTKINGELKKGKKVNIEYSKINEELNELELKSIEVID